MAWAIFITAVAVVGGVVVTSTVNIMVIDVIIIIIYRGCWWQ